MQTNADNTIGTSKNPGLASGKANGFNSQSDEMKSTNVEENGTQRTPVKKIERRNGYINAYPIPVSEQQFMTVREEQLSSMNLLNSSGNALLSAMEGLIPHQESGRVVGEYTAQAMRKLAKSVCDIVRTKTMVVQSMYQIARDEL